MTTPFICFLSAHRSWNNLSCSTLFYQNLQITQKKTVNSLRLFAPKIFDTGRCFFKLFENVTGVRIFEIQRMPCVGCDLIITIVIIVIGTYCKLRSSMLLLGLRAVFDLSADSWMTSPERGVTSHIPASRITRVFINQVTISSIDRYSLCTCRHFYYNSNRTYWEKFHLVELNVLIKFHKNNQKVIYF